MNAIDYAHLIGKYVTIRVLGQGDEANVLSIEWEGLVDAVCERPYGYLVLKCADQQQDGYLNVERHSYIDIEDHRAYLDRTRK